jgi:transcriptional regulator with XRE-family HTH domain
MNKKALGKKLAELLDEKGWTQQQLADELHRRHADFPGGETGQVTVSRRLKGVGLDAAEADRIAEALGYNVIVSVVPAVASPAEVELDDDAREILRALIQVFPLLSANEVDFIADLVHRKVTGRRAADQGRS